MAERLARLRPEPNSSPEVVYDTLRQSLSSTQRRCSSLNEDMLRVADANEELMASMVTVKATNRRLADQLQSQGDEIAQLTKLRLVDEERLEELSRQHREETRRWRADLEERVRASEGEVASAFQDQRMRLVGKLTELRRSARLLTPKLQGLRRLQAAAAAEAKAGLAEWRSGVLDHISSRLSERFAAQRRRDEAALTKFGDEAHAKAAKLAFERDARQREISTWRLRDSELATEGSELAGRLEAELARLRSELEAAEAEREAEARGAEQDRLAVCCRLRELVSSTSSLDVLLESSRGTLLAMEEQRLRKETERKRLDEEMRAARQSLQRSDEALEKAVANNEDLRRQMEAQRAQAHSSRSRTLAERSQQMEAELATQLADQRRETSAQAEKVAELERRLAAGSGELTRLQLAAERRGAERSALRRQCALWKAQEELAAQLRDEAGRGRREAKEDWDRQLQQLQTQHGALSEKEVAMEEELRCSQSASADFRRVSGQKSAKAQAEVAVLEGRVSEADEALGATRRALQEKVAMLAAVRSEASNFRARSALARDDLDGQLQQLSEDARRAREKLLSEMGIERQRAQRAEMECEELQRQGQFALEEAQAEPIAQVATLEREMQDIRSKHNAEAKELGMTFETYRKKVDSAEVERTRLQGLVEETERQLQSHDGALRQVREGNLGRQEQLERDLAAERERLAASWARRGRKAAASAKSGEEQAKQKREVERLITECEEQARAGEAQLEAFRRQSASLLAARKDVMRAELGRQSQALDAAEAENRRLRHPTLEPAPLEPLAAEPIATAISGSAAAAAKVRPSIEDSRWDVQDSIGRMQWHTDRLRRELRQQQQQQQQQW